MMKLKIREAVLSDYIDVSKLVLEVHKLHVKNRPDVYVDTNTPLEKEYFIELLSANDTKLFVVEDTNNEELVAYSIVKIIAPRSIQILIPSKVAFIDDFCVKANYKQKGIGKKLFNHIVEYVKSEECSSLQLVVWEFNKDAISFYEKLGMVTRNRRMELNF